MSATSETQKPTVSFKPGKRTVRSSFVNVIKKHPKNQLLLTTNFHVCDYSTETRGQVRNWEETKPTNRSEIVFSEVQNFGTEKKAQLIAAVKYENGAVFYCPVESVGTIAALNELEQVSLDNLVSNILSNGCAASPDDYTFQQFGENLILAIPKNPNQHELLGSGSFGDVIKAYPVKNTGEIDTQHPVAVKIMKQERKDTGNKLLWDVMASNKASYSSRVTKIGYQGKQRLASVMSELPKDLYTQHKIGMLEQRLDQQGRNRLAQQYVEAQHTLHENRVFQKDTKSHNVSVGFEKKENGEYDTYVTFFDLDGTAFTFLSVAPEILQGASANAASDIYSATESLARIFGAKEPYASKSLAFKQYQSACGNMDKIWGEQDKKRAEARRKELGKKKKPTQQQREQWAKEDAEISAGRKKWKGRQLLTIAETKFDTLGIEQNYSGKAYTKIINLLSAMSNNDSERRPSYNKIKSDLEEIERLLRKEEVDWADLESDPKDEADRKRKLSVLQERAEKREEAIKEALGINEPELCNRERVIGMKALHHEKLVKEDLIRERLEKWQPREQTIHLVEITDDESKSVADPSKAVANPGEEQKRRLDGILQSTVYTFSEANMIQHLWIDLVEMTDELIKTFGDPEKLISAEDITGYNQAVTLRAHLVSQKTVQLRKLPGCQDDNGKSTQPLFEEKTLESYSRKEIITTLATTLNTKVTPKTEKQASLLGAIKNLVSRLISIFDTKPQVGISGKPESKSDSALANNIAGLFGPQKDTKYAKGLQARLENHLETTAALIPVTA